MPQKSKIRHISKQRKLLQHGLKLVGITLSLIFVIIVGLWGFVAIASKRIEVTYPPEGKFIEVDGVRLHYVREGEGDPVVFLHCGGCCLGYFTKTPLHSLAIEEYEAIVFDRYGSGYSDISPEAYTTPTEQAILLRNALKKMGVERSVLVGSSAGGAVAMAYALEYPDEVAGIVLPGGWVYAEDEPGGLSALANTPIVGDIFINAIWPSLIYAVTGLSDEIPGPDPAPSQEYLTGPLRLAARPKQVRTALVQEADFSKSLQDFSSRYGELNLPIIYVAGSEDISSIEQAEQLIKAVPNAELVIVENAGHFSYFGHPEVVMQAIQDVWAIAR